jgi:hypothetical protein
MASVWWSALSFRAASRIVIVAVGSRSREAESRRDLATTRRGVSMHFVRTRERNLKVEACIFSSRTVV